MSNQPRKIHSLPTQIEKDEMSMGIFITIQSIQMSKTDRAL